MSPAAAATDGRLRRRAAVPGPYTTGGMSIDRVSHRVQARSRPTRTAPPAATAVPGAPRSRSRSRRDVLDADAVDQFLSRAARTLQRHRGLLDRLDAALGDGDHGENMAIGFNAVLASLPVGLADDLGARLRTVGHALVASVGGASGPLYGTAFIEAGYTLGAVTRLTPGAIADALEAAVRGLSRRGRCAVGDKTILDALAPAAVAFRASLDAGEAVETCIRHAAWAAHAGMRATTPLVARRGLALRLGPRSRGHQDPGATSCFLLVRAMLPRPDARAGRTAVARLREREP